MLLQLTQKVPHLETLTGSTLITKEVTDQSAAPLHPLQLGQGQGHQPVDLGDGQ